MGDSIIVNMKDSIIHIVGDGCNVMNVKRNIIMNNANIFYVA